MGTTDIFINPALGLLGILNLLGAVQGLLLSLALVSSKADNKTANRLLAALILTISIVVSGSVLLSSDYVFVFPHLSRIHHPFVFLAGPLVYLYIRSLVLPEKQTDKKDLLHFIPFVFCLIYLLPYYFQSGFGKLQVISSEYLEASFGAWYYIRSSVFFTQFFGYLVLTVLLIVKYSKSIRDGNSRRDRSVLFEIKFFVIASSILWMGAIVRYAFDTGGTSNLLVPLGASILIYAMGYLKMRRPATGPAEPEQIEEVAKKYEKSQLTPERSERHLGRLLELMETEQPFTDGDLTIQKLAERLSVTVPHLSQTINERMGKTFPEFINSYRIEEAKKRLLDPSRKHYTVLAIAEEVGFNSKSAFNDVFKKHVKMTPSEYRKSLETNNSSTE